MKDLTYISDSPGNLGDWKGRHLKAVRHPFADKEMPFLKMLQGWLDYANSHEARFGSPVGEDHILGNAWIRLGLALSDMLEGDLGPRLDCGTLSTIIVDNLAEQGWDMDLGERKAKS